MLELQRFRIVIGSGLVALASVAAARGEGKVRPKQDLADIVGSSHVAGQYNFTDQDYLNEGADVLLKLGSRVIKLWFNADPAKSYPFNSQWPEVRSLVELAQTPYFKRVFAKPFTTYLLEAYAPPADGQSRRRDQHYFVRGMTAEDIAQEKQAFYEIARYLLTEYRHTGKTFVLQNWEGDWVLTPPRTDREADDKAIEGMIAWLNARQDGIAQARAELGTDGVMVVHAAEVNLVDKAMKGKKCVTNNVLPRTHCDLYSYSAYDTSLRGPKEFRAALDYLAARAPDSDLYGSRNVFVGEFGAPENSHPQAKIVEWTTQTALDFGAPYVVYWQVYCNEEAGDQEERAKHVGRRANSHMRGFWLIRPDGTHSPAYDYFARLLHSKPAAGASRPASANRDR